MLVGNGRYTQRPLVVQRTHEKQGKQRAARLCNAKISLNGKRPPPKKPETFGAENKMDYGGEKKNDSIGP